MEEIQLTIKYYYFILWMFRNISLSKKFAQRQLSDVQVGSTVNIDSAKPIDSILSGAVQYRVRNEFMKII